MKKKTRLNRSIIKAMTLGISATIMTSPVTAFAGELGDQGDLDSLKDTLDRLEMENEDESLVLVQTEAGQTEKAVEDATEDIRQVVDDIRNTAENAESLLTGDAVDAAVERIEETLKPVVDESTEENSTPEAVANADEQTGVLNGALMVEAMSAAPASTDTITNITPAAPTEDEGNTEEDQDETAIDAINGGMDTIVSNLTAMSHYEATVQAGERALEVLAKSANDIVPNFDAESREQAVEEAVTQAETSVNKADTTVSGAVKTYNSAIKEATTEEDVTAA